MTKNLPAMKENQVRSLVQKILWQTDPLYETVRRECEGVVEARYFPDETEEGWRCACGQINLPEAKACGGCGCSREWLNKHFDREYLEQRKAVYDEKRGQEPAAVKKTKTGTDPDRIKAGLIFGSVLLIVLLTVLSVKVFIPSIRYGTALRQAENGEYDKAIGVFQDITDRGKAS